MNTYEKLRKAVYAIKYPDGIPLEGYCEVIVRYGQFKNKRMYLDKEDFEYVFVYNGEDAYEAVEKDHMHGDVIENLGKDLELSAIMLALGEDYACTGRGTIQRQSSYHADAIIVEETLRLDLTKEIKEQDEYVLEKLLDLINDPQ